MCSLSTRICSLEGSHRAHHRYIECVLFILEYVLLKVLVVHTTGIYRYISLHICRYISVLTALHGTGGLEDTIIQCDTLGESGTGWKFHGVANVLLMCC